MMTRRYWLAIGAILLATVAMCGSQLGWADGGAASRYGLKGVKGFFVEVGNLPYDVEGWGLTRADVQRDVELQLRKGGALVLTREQAMDSPNAPRLHVRILASKQHNSPYYNYCTVLSFDQAAVLSRDASITVDASTWSKAGLGMIKKKQLPEVRAVISGMVDEFLNIYLSENPR